MPTIRIDNDVYEWLKSLAVPFEDNPNSVLRRVAGLEKGLAEHARKGLEALEVGDEEAGKDISSNRITGKSLSEGHGIEASQSLYSDTGTFYENLKRFPGVLWDKHGYLKFQSEGDYLRSPYLQVGVKLNVPNGGISSVPGYVRVR